MSAVAASAAHLRALIEKSVGGAPRRRLRAVPAAAGSVSGRVTSPLSLGRDARARLGGAVGALLGLPGLDGAPDAVRLAVVVLAARTPSESGVVEIRTSELSRWLGLSASYVASDVLPVLRRSGVVSVETAEGEYGQDDGLKCRVLPLWAARDVVGHPLNLKKSELATLLRLMEAVMGPGWTHRDGRVTPAGLIGTRTGRGAATDRLALLLLVLEAQETGRVRLCGGAVDTKRGRAATTVARLLGCSASAGERVLERLEARKLVLRVRRRTASGLANRSRLMVPAVAAAHGRTVADDVQEDRAEALDPQISEPDVAARPGQAPGTATEPQVSGVPVTDEPDVAEPDVAADLHTDHPPLVTPVSPPALSGGFSGEGRGGNRGLPDRACARDDDGPLRGEKPKKSPVSELGEQRAPGGGAGGQPKAVGWDKTQRQRRAALPADLRLRVALGPVSGLWERLSGWQQDQVEAATKAELVRLAGLLIRPEDAPRLLADRLTDRLHDVGGEARVRDAMGWLIGRGLIQRRGCPDRRCDDGIRLDTRGDCPTCASLIADRRARRARLRAVVDSELVDVPAQQRRTVYEERLRKDMWLEAARAERRRERAEAEVSRRRAVAEERRRELQAAELERQSTPCVECGLPESAGLCPPCTYQRRTDELVREAVDLVVAVRADLNDPDQIAALTEQCEADTRALIAKTCHRAGHKGVLAAFTAQEVAERIRDERRASAHRRLLESEQAEVEADAVYDTVLRSSRGAQAAQTAADDARRRTAEYLLRQRVGQLQAARDRAATGWRSRPRPMSSLAREALPDPVGAAGRAGTIPAGGEHGVRSSHGTESGGPSPRARGAR